MTIKEAIETSMKEGRTVEVEVADYAEAKAAITEICAHFDGEPNAALDWEDDGREWMVWGDVNLKIRQRA